MGKPIRLAIVGMGLVGPRHASAIAAVSEASLCAVVDPDPRAKAQAEAFGAAHYAALDDLLCDNVADGIILATPNQLHLEQALSCISANLPTLIEKPLAADVAGARRIVDAGKAAGVCLATGHHRRHTGVVSKARELIDSGALGQLVSVQASTWFYKPDDYFNVAWRCEPGAGPIYINLIHDIDLLRHFIGEIESVHCMQSSRTRGHAVEDSAVISLRFTNGALGTVNVSDAISAPWSWELTARENPAYPATDGICYKIGGTDASLALPNLSLWRHDGEKSWWSPIGETKLPHTFEDPFIRQIRQFCAVVRGEEEPLVPAIEGLRNQIVLDAVKMSAESEKPVHLASV